MGSSDLFGVAPFYVQHGFLVHNDAKVCEDFVSPSPEKKRRVWEVLGYSDIKDIKYIKISKSDIKDI